jgi:hypothetical protein
MCATLAASWPDLSQEMKAKISTMKTINELPGSGSGGLFITRFEKVVLALMLLQVALQVLRFAGKFCIE